MFNFPKCTVCQATLPIATGVCAHCPVSPSPAQESPSESIAAPAEVGQGLGTKKEDPREKLFRLRLEIAKRQLLNGVAEVAPDFVLVRQTDLRNLRLLLDQAVRMSSPGSGRSYVVQSRDSLIRLQSVLMTLEHVLSKVGGK